MQRKLTSLTESIAITLTGLVVNFGLGFIIYPLWGLPVNIGQNTGIVLTFTMFAVIRNYIVRRVFNGIGR